MSHIYLKRKIPQNDQLQGVPKKTSPKSIACEKIRKNIYGLPRRLEVARLICFSGKIVLINNNKHKDNYMAINYCYRKSNFAKNRHVINKDS